MAQILSCKAEDITITATGEIQCTNWVLIDQAEYYEDLFGFDPVIFGTVGGAILLAHLSGIWTGQLVRLLKRT